MTSRVTCWTRSVKPHNEDAVATGTGFLLVADGATSLGGDPEMNYRTATFTDVLVAEVAAQLEDGQVTAGALECGLQRAQEICGSHGVTSTLSLACWLDGAVELALIGDSPVVLETDTGMEMVVDPAFESREKIVLGRVLSQVAAGAGFPAAYAGVAAEQHGNRDTRNTGEGMWVVSDYTDAARVVEHMHTATRPDDDLVRLAVMTDGASAAVDTFHALNFAELLYLHENDGLVALFEDLDARELADPERSRYPRLSYRDDATLALARFG